MLVVVGFIVVDVLMVVVVVIIPDVVVIIVVVPLVVFIVVVPVVVFIVVVEKVGCEGVDPVNCVEVVPVGRVGVGVDVVKVRVDPVFVY